MLFIERLVVIIINCSRSWSVRVHHINRCSRVIRCHMDVIKELMRCLECLDNSFGPYFRKLYSIVKKISFINNFLTYNHHHNLLDLHKIQIYYFKFVTMLLCLRFKCEKKLVTLYSIGMIK